MNLAKFLRTIFYSTSPDDCFKIKTVNLPTLLKTFTRLVVSKQKYFHKFVKENFVYCKKHATLRNHEAIKNISSWFFKIGFGDKPNY